MTSTKKIQPVHEPAEKPEQAPENQLNIDEEQPNPNKNFKKEDGIDKNKEQAALATFREVFSFAQTIRVKAYIFLGSFCAIISGLTFPAMAFLFSNSFTDLAASPSGDDFMESIRSLSFKFLVLGAVMFTVMVSQAALFEAAANEMTQTFKRKWFGSLLRQDMAYYDITDVSGTATIINTNGMKFKNGVGRKFSEGIQFSVVGISGFSYGLWSSWQVSLLVLTILPFLALSTRLLLRMNRSQTLRSNESYSKAGSIVYTTVSSIRTIFSLSAVEEMINKFSTATEEAYQGASSQMILIGFANGSVMASFLCGYFPLILFGSYLLYSEVEVSGCDPSGSVDTNMECETSAAGLLGALMGITFGGATLAQVSASVEAFTGARSAAYPALVAISRRSAMDDDNAQEVEEKCEALQRRGSYALLPRYEIDSSSTFGLKPEVSKGNIVFHDVTFHYPTRQQTDVFKGFSLHIKPGQTVALVGPSGCGKSTVVQLLERFYDPVSGSIALDGQNIRNLNVKWLRQQIGLVSQEPKLFAMTIRENIRIGSPNSSQKEIEAAARKANAHEFITAFPDGYDTFVGHEGTQLSGGQKQRIAIARVLLKKPNVIILDEATSALDSECEAMVQEAIDKIMREGKQTVIVIAHRLSTIKNADKIAVVQGGKVVESGTHDALLKKQGAYFDLVETQAGRKPMSGTSSFVLSDGSSGSSSPTTSQVDDDSCVQEGSDDVQLGSRQTLISFKKVHFHYPTRPNVKIFRGLSFSITEGETLAIVGPSGQGKSTIIQLLESFYYPTEGKIKYRGVNVRDINVKWLRKQFAFVGQEPSLFDDTIAENIRFGLPDATQAEIEEAAKQANAHRFIMEFPEKYETKVGAGSTKISGGQKQRIAIARALIRKPRVLLLDEATSALDSESEQVVQDALDKAMADTSLTTIVIAHRLSTIRNADRIAVVNKGKVVEIGSHDELMALPKGHYKRLQALQDLGSIGSETANKRHSKSDKKSKKRNSKGASDQQGKTNPMQGEEDSDYRKKRSKRNATKARMFARGNEGYFAIGTLGAIMAGLMFPGWGFMFANMIELLYKPVYPCDPETNQICTPDAIFCQDIGMTCEDYWMSIAEDMQERSVKIALVLLGVIGAAFFGHGLTWYGFGTASERINKTVRDACFEKLIRQEVGWFDSNSVGALTAQLSEDAAKLHTFSGEPIRSLVLALSSVFVGLAVAMFYMWPFALLASVTIPLMAFAAKTRFEMFVGRDEGAMEGDNDFTSPGGIVIESLSNIRTVASLSLEDERLERFSQAMQAERPNTLLYHSRQHCSTGLGQLVRIWTMALYFFWGGWLLSRFADVYSFRDFLIAMFSLMFSVSGLSVAMQGMTDGDQARAAADRIFDLLERTSQIDPLSEEGQKDLQLTHVSHKKKAGRKSKSHEEKREEKRAKKRKKEEKHAKKERRRERKEERKAKSSKEKHHNRHKADEVNSPSDAEE